MAPTEMPMSMTFQALLNLRLSERSKRQRGKKRKKGKKEEEEAFGVLPGSQAESQEGAIGLSYVGERGFLGFSVSTRDAKYGLPGHSHHHHHEEEDHDEEGHDEE